MENFVKTTLIGVYEIFSHNRNVGIYWPVDY
jgi:hypothetical protein